MVIQLFIKKKGKKKVDFNMSLGVSHQNKPSEKINIFSNFKNDFKDLYIIDLNCLCLF